MVFSSKGRCNLGCKKRIFFTRFVYTYTIYIYITIYILYILASPVHVGTYIYIHVRIHSLYIRACLFTAVASAWVVNPKSPAFARVLHA